MPDVIENESIWYRRHFTNKRKIIDYHVLQNLYAHGHKTTYGSNVHCDNTNKSMEAVTTGFMGYVGLYFPFVSTFSVFIDHWKLWEPYNGFDATLKIYGEKHQDSNVSTKNEDVLFQISKFVSEYFTSY